MDTNAQKIHRKNNNAMTNN